MSIHTFSPHSKSAKYCAVCLVPISEHPQFSAGTATKKAREAMEVDLAHEPARRPVVKLTLPPYREEESTLDEILANIAAAPDLDEETKRLHALVEALWERMTRKEKLETIAHSRKFKAVFVKAENYASAQMADEGEEE